MASHEEATDGKDDVLFPRGAAPDLLHGRIHDHDRLRWELVPAETGVNVDAYIVRVDKDVPIIIKQSPSLMNLGGIHLEWELTNI